MSDSESESEFSFHRQGPAMRMSFFFNILISVFGFLAMSFSGWAASSLGALKEQSIRQEGTNNLMSERLTSVSDKLTILGNNSYTKSDAERDWSNQHALDDSIVKRLEACEARRQR